jgi:hypothetical protein
LVNVLVKIAWVLGGIAWVAWAFILFGTQWIAGLVLVILSIAYFIYRIILSRRRKEETIRAGAKLTIKAKHLDGLRMGNTLCKLYLFEETLRIDNAFTNTYYDVPLSRVYAAGRASQLTQAEFSMTGAILGEMIEGPVGAIIGGVIGGKRGKSSVLVIRFLDTENKDVQFSFELCPRWSLAFDSLTRILRKRAKRNVKNAV